MQELPEALGNALGVDDEHTLEQGDSRLVRVADTWVVTDIDGKLVRVADE